MSEKEILLELYRKIKKQDKQIEYLVDSQELMIQILTEMVKKGK